MPDFGPLLWTFYIVVLLPMLCWTADDHFRDISSGVFTDNSGYLAAFGDFNSDKAIDVFVLKAKHRGGGFRNVILNQAPNSRISEENFLVGQSIENTEYFAE